MSLTIRLQFSLFAVISSRIFNVFSAGFDSIFSLMLARDKPFSINFIHVVVGPSTFFCLLQALIKSYICWYHFLDTLDGPANSIVSSRLLSSMALILFFILPDFVFNVKSIDLNTILRPYLLCYTFVHICCSKF